MPKYRARYEIQVKRFRRDTNTQMLDMIFIFIIFYFRYFMIFWNVRIFDLCNLGAFVLLTPKLFRRWIRNISLLGCQYRVCWSTGSLSRQCISRHDIGSVVQTICIVIPDLISSIRLKPNPRPDLKHKGIIRCIRNTGSDWINILGQSGAYKSWELGNWFRYWLVTSSEPSQATTWTNPDVSSIKLPGIHPIKILFKIPIFSLNERPLKVADAIWPPFCSSRIVLKYALLFFCVFFTYHSGQCHWYRNIMNQPQTIIQKGRQNYGHAFRLYSELIQNHSFEETEFTKIVHQSLRLLRDIRN